MAEPSVQMSGFVLASFMFQHVNNDEDVEGLILGQSRVDEQITINDSQADHIHTEEIYNIQKHATFHKLNHFYNSVGDIDVEALTKALSDNKQESVIGWYRQRRNTDHQMTYREKVVHEKLKVFLSNPHILFVLFTSSQVTSSGSTHSMEYAAFISRNSHFLHLPIIVTNLGSLDQQEYWKVSTLCSAAGYDLTMRKHGSNFFSSNGLLKEVDEIVKMNESLQAELQKTCRVVEQSERQVEHLQAEVSALRRKVAEKKRSTEEEVTVVDPPEEKNNFRLQDAINRLFPNSPVLDSQTVTSDGFPGPDNCCSFESSGIDSSVLQTSENQSRMNCQRRGRKRKRRNSRY
ncbi:BRCA1-A complex subunit Abraxas 1 [Cynoglossus semilaevis]|uniref:Abraxas 1, BRCA1 A complex subunit n=1 Tax=Cynoglossus semilaevis TaxID=244447 RepID=A0A3P8UL49_CYNSE|nr:BRCA1-A complex subunit Abraxas 1 [Cynoglossus semilaevis]XP_024918117.1 BRCA1-A complex subunit Abraxas 1 [Cynoglossus semilaevis]